MAEVEIGGAKITGGKLFWALPLLGALGSGAWGGFTLYQEFLDLREATENYVSPDLSHIDNHMTMVEGELGIISAEFNALKEVDAATSAVIREQINSVKAISAQLQTDLHDLRMDLNQDTAETNNAIEVKSDKINANIDKQEARLEKQDSRNRQNIEDVRGVINTFELRFESTISSFEERMDSKMSKLDQKLDNLEAALDKKIQRAIDNPLAGN